MTQSLLRAIVVDDELLAREGLRDDLTALGVVVIATCEDAQSAIIQIRTKCPEILFLDIEMPVMNGFALLEQLEPEELPPAVIFITAYDQHAMLAFEARALDYLLKPVSTERLKAAIQRALQRVKEVRALRETSSNPDKSADEQYLTRIAVRDRDATTIIPVDNLEWVEAETYYVRLHATGMRPRLLRERMSVLESRLDPEKFFRSHRSAIIRLDLVREIRSASKYEHTIVLSSGAVVPLSRDRRVALSERVNGLARPSIP